MRRASALPAIAAFFFLTCALPGKSSAEKVNPSRAVAPDASPSQGQPTEIPETAPLPTQLSAERLGALAIIPPARPAKARCTCSRWTDFYRGAANHPLTAREVAMREFLRKLSERQGQYVHVELKTGKVLTGTIERVDTQQFYVKTGAFDYYSPPIAYRDVAETPRAVAAVGTRVVHGMQWTGLVAVCVVLLPIALVAYPLLLALGVQD